MPTLCFFPWATITERLSFGAFHVVPCVDALKSGEIPVAQHDAVQAVLGTYHPRPVDQHEIPLLRHTDRGFTDDLTEEETVDYFDFRLRLAFAVLAGRQLFDLRYVNSDHVRLVLQGFTTERAGGAAVTSRRRDGHYLTFISPEMRRVSRPEHVHGAAKLPQDLDRELLAALEAVAAPDDELAARVADAVRLYVGANTDSADVSAHSELVDVVSAFGRVADSWEKDGIVRDVLRALPPPVDDHWAPREGPKAQHADFARGRAKGWPIRRVWLEDVIALRHQYGHGRVLQPHTKTWTLHEHLLLGAVALPLYLKARLQEAGHYAFTERDHTQNLAFDALTTIEPFAEADDDGNGRPGRDKRSGRRWRELLALAQMHRYFRRESDRLHVRETEDADGRHLEIDIPNEPTGDE